MTCPKCHLTMEHDPMADQQICEQCGLTLSAIDVVKALNEIKRNKVNTLGLAWALPVSLVGWLVVVLGWTEFGTVHRSAYVCVAKPGGLCAWFFRRGFVGITIGHIIIVASRARLEDERLLAHEYRHVQQTMALGPLFPIAYGLASLWAWLSGGHYYRDNWFERDAERAER